MKKFEIGEQRERAIKEKRAVDIIIERERAIERKRKIDQLVEEYVGKTRAVKRYELKRKKDFIDFIYVSLILALIAGIVFFAGIGLITVLSR
jgi:hypothetical protein